MCLYPKLILNRKYTVTKKNGGNVPYMYDPRLKYVAVGCGNCIECRKQKANGWRTRMLEELKHNPTKANFVTLTFSNDSLEELCKAIKCKESNAVAGIAIRRFLERWRKKYKKSIKHWLITELGHKGTERIHIHGIIWTNEDKETINNIWQYGHIDVGDYCDESSINYIVKYVTKIDEDHKNFRGQIFCSAGIGREFINTYNAQQRKYKGYGKTNETYPLNNGTKIGLPIYYRNKLYTEDEREKLWLEKLDKGERYVLGQRVRKEDENYYWELLRNAQEKNRRLGYGDDSKMWRKEDYNITLRQLKKGASLTRKPTKRR